MSLNLAQNQLCGLNYWADIQEGGTYTAKGITAIANALHVNASLTSLDLSNNVLCGMTKNGGTYNAEGITAIANALRVNGGLTTINLSGNQLCGFWTDGRCNLHGDYTAEGITAIAIALRVNGSLTKLSLAENKLGEEGTKFLCDALVGNNTLKELDMMGEKSFRGTGSNIGGTAGAKHVANMLLVNGSLTKMWYVLPRRNLSKFGPSFQHPCANDGNCQCTTLLCEAAHCRCRSCVVQPLCLRSAFTHAACAAKESSSLAYPAI